jgi:hypothetical protein
MRMKKLRPVTLLMLAFATCSMAHAEDVQMDCRLRGGTMVQLPAEACTMEGGVPISGAVPATSGAMPAAPVTAPPAAEAVPASAVEARQLSSDPKLAAAQKAIIDLLNKPVVDRVTHHRNPEGIERTARFDGCKLMVEENLHMDIGNLMSTRKNFRIRSVIDLRKIDRNEFGMLGEVNSKGGDLKAAAVFFEEGKRRDGNDISISVLQAKNGGFEKATALGPAPYLDAPRYDLWIEDEYGYPKDAGLGYAATDKVRILFIVGSMDDAEKLKGALEGMHALCRQ